MFPKNYQLKLVFCLKKHLVFVRKAAKKVRLALKQTHLVFAARYDKNERLLKSKT